MATQPANPISNALQALLNTFASSSPDAAAVAQKLTNALNNDAALRDQLNSEVGSGALKAFALGAPANTAAVANPNTQTITFNKSQVDQGLPGDLIFQMAHEAQHLQNLTSNNATSEFPANIQTAANDFTSGIKSDNPNYTDLINANQLVRANDETIAQINGWNVYVASMQNLDPATAAKSLYDGSYLAHYFLDDQGRPLPGITLNADNTITLNSANVAAERQLYYYNSSALNGVGYTNYNAVWEMNQIFASGKDNVPIDFQSIQGWKLSNIAAEANLISGGDKLASGAFTVTDSSTGAFVKFNTDSTGTTITSTLITAPTSAGTQTNTTTYSPNGQLSQAQSLADSDGKIQHSDSTTYTDYSGKTVSTETAVSNNYDTGVSTITTTNYNPTAGVSCTIDTKTQAILGSGTAFSDDFTSISSTGATTVTVSGTGAQVNASNAAITIADGATTTLNGSGNDISAGAGANVDLEGAANTFSGGLNGTITIGATGGQSDQVTMTDGNIFVANGASVSIAGSNTVQTSTGKISVTGNSQITTSANGKTSSLSEDSNGDGKTDIQETISLGADGATTTDLKDLSSTGALDDESLTVSQIDGSKTVSLDKDGNGTFEEKDEFNAGGKETDSLLYNDITGAQTKDEQYDLSTGVIADVLNYDATGHETDEAFYNPSGQETGDNVYNAAGQLTDAIYINPTTGFRTQDQQFDTSTGKVTDAVNYNATGQVTDEAFYNPSGQMTGDGVLNSSGQQTDFLVFDPATGHETQDQQFNLSTHTVADALNFDATGRETDEAFYNSAQQETGDNVYNAAGQLTDAVYFNPSTGLKTQDQQYDTSTGKVADALNYNSAGQETDEAFYNPAGQEIQDSQFNLSTGMEADRLLFNTAGQETDLLFFDGSGRETQDQQFNLSTGKVAGALNFNTSGRETDEAFYNPSGQETGDNVYNAAGQLTDAVYFNPSTGLKTQDQQYDTSTGKVADALNYNSAGQETDEAIYNPAGQEIQDSQFNISTGMEADRLLFNTAGQETDLLFFDGSGRETQDQQFNLSTGKVADALNFNAAGQETDEAYYNTAGQETQDSQFNLSTGMEVDRLLFNTTGQETDLIVFNSSGRETQDSQFSTSTGREADRLLYNNAGQETDLLFFNPSGQETQDQQFNTSTGTVADVLNYNTAGQETDEAFYNTSGQELSDARFNPGSPYAYEVDKFNTNGNQIERDTFNQGSGALNEVDLWNGSSPYAYEREVANGGGYFSEVDNYDPNSGAMTGGAQFNGQTGAETEYETGGYWYGYGAGGTYYAPSGDGGYGGFTYAGPDYTGGDDSGDDCPDGIDPVILNLQGGKVQTQSLATSHASFDMQNDGQAVKTGWATAGEGMLVFDPTNSSSVKDDASLVSGFDALKGLDGNGDGKIDASDAAWSDLKVWVDQSGTGQFDTGSLYSMAQLGIASIDLGAKHMNQNSNGNTILDDSSFTRTDGTTGDIAGVNLSFNPMSNVSTVQTQATTQLNQLIGAMASFAPPASALTALSAANDRLHQSPLLAAAH